MLRQGEINARRMKWKVFPASLKKKTLTSGLEFSHNFKLLELLGKHLLSCGHDQRAQI